MKNKKLIIIILIALMAISGGVGLYYQSFIFEVNAIPIQTTVAYIFGGLCCIALGLTISDKRKVLKKLLIVWGILAVVSQIIFALLF